MTLIVETGSGMPDSESYESVANADTYHANRGNTAWAALTTPQKEIALRKGTDYLMQVYRARWKGYRVMLTQALDWPRYNVYIDDSEVSQYVQAITVPKEVKSACCELALKSTEGDLAPDLDRETASESVGSISVSYFQGSARNKEYRAIDLTLKPLLKSGGLAVEIVRA